MIDPTEVIEVRPNEVVIRRGERDRVEKKHCIARDKQTAVSLFSHRNEFAEVFFDGRTYRFGPCQARVVHILHEASKTDSPWLHGKAVLGRAGSSCTRMADLFKAKKAWRELILSDGRGKYRLNIPRP